MVPSKAPYIGRKNVRQGLRAYDHDQAFQSGSVSVRNHVGCGMILYSYEAPIVAYVNGRHFINYDFYSNTTRVLQNAAIQYLQIPKEQQVTEKELNCAMIEAVLQRANGETASKLLKETGFDRQKFGFDPYAIEVEGV